MSLRLLIALLLASTAAGCDREKGETPQPAQGAEAPTPAAEKGKLDRSYAGRPMPAVQFNSPERTPVTLAKFRGKPLLLNLWATWCGPCVVEMPTLDKLAAAKPDLQVVAVSQDTEGQEDKVAAFFRDRKLERLDAYQDPNLALMEKLEAAVLPTTILYDSSGKEVWRMVGAMDWNGAEAAKLIAEAR